MKKINLQELVRPHILKMQPYSSARTEYTGNSGIFLDANENPIGSVTATFHNRYPDPLQQNVKKELALLENVQPTQIFLGNGSDECIDVLVRTFCEPKQDKIIVCPPVFSMYEHSAQAQNVEVIAINLKENFQLNLDEILNEINENKTLKIIFICSPNNPTGNLIHTEDIEKILNTFSGIVLIDEAYQDFSTNESWIKRLNEFGNLVVIKTFSKAYGMADARIGMLYANETIVHYMNAIKLPYNINQHSQQLALEALKNIHKKEAFVAELLQSRDNLIAELSKINFIKEVFPSDANYILFKVEDANKLYQYLIEENIIVRNRNSAPLLKGCLRVSVGTKQENKIFIEKLKQYKA